MNEIQHLLHLPNEILLKILENLSATSVEAVRLTCSRLYNLCNSREILKKQKFVIVCNYPEQTREELNTITESEKKFLNLELILRTRIDKSNDTDDIFIQSLCSSGAKINSLIIKSRFYILNFAVIDAILISCVNLKELALYGIGIIKGSKTSLETVRPRDRNLKLDTLILRDCTNFSDHTINTFLNFYPAIKILNLHLTNITDGSFYTNFDQPTNKVLTADFLIHKITTCNKHIKMLQYYSLGFSLSEQQIQKLFISSDLRLQIIHFTGEFVLSETQFKDFVVKHNLTEFKLRHCKNFNLECLQNLLKYCPNLQSLSLSYLPEIVFMETAKVLSQMGRSLKRFEYQNNLLFTGDLPDTTDWMFQNLEYVILKLHFKTINLDCLKNCRNLKSLTIHLYEAGTCDYDVTPIISASQNTLVKLDLYWSPNGPAPVPIHSETPRPLFFPKLELLDIETPKGLTREVVGDFNFPSLKRLVINGSYNIQTQDYFLMMDGCPLLELLKIRLEEPMCLMSLDYNWRFLKESNFIILFRKTLQRSDMNNETVSMF